MSEPDLFAQDILDAQPDLFDTTRLARVSAIVRTYSGQTVTGASMVKVRLGDEDLECDWLRSFHLSIVAGAVTQGSLVLVHLVGGQCVIADVITIGAKSSG